MNATIALMGNPNSGKSTLFNLLTGSRQHVGNYPGITVEKHEGVLRLGDTDVAVVGPPVAQAEQISLEIRKRLARERMHQVFAQVREQ